VALQTSGAAVVHRDVAGQLAQRITEALREFHAAKPMRMGMDAAELLTCAGAEPTLFDLVVEQLIRAEKLQRHERLLALSDHAPAISPEDQDLCAELDRLLRKAHLASPLPGELAQRLEIPAERLATLLALLADRGQVVQLDAKVVMHRQAVEAARKVVLDLFARANSFTTMEFRDALGVSRKYAVPLLDYFDTVRLTVRSGNRRTPGAEAKKASTGHPEPS